MFLLSDERIRELSHGEVLNMGKYNFNYKHPKPIPDGLYAENIFGPEHDYTCTCGHHNPRAKKSDTILTCEVCGVDYVKADERSKRYGHIELNCHYINPLFLKTFAELIDVTPETLQAVSLGEVNLELEENTAGALYGLDGKRYCLIIDNSPELKGGISGLYDLLERNIDCVETLRFSYAGVSEKYQKAGYNLLSFINSTVVVTPPDARPLRRADEKIFYDETNLIYSRLIRESSKLAALMSSDSLTPEQIQVVKSMTSCVVQKMINIQFIEGGEFGNAKLIPRIEKLKGKEGSLPRGALLGKTVDFSGRSVILSAPDMPINSVGIPYAMLLELFKPDIIHWLTQKHRKEGTPSIKAFRKAQAQVKRLAPDTMEAIEGVVKNEYIILNRAPSLHMYSVMAFQVIPVSGKAIHMPPAAMAPFNADCDGDTMSTHRHISDEACQELKEVVSFERNLLSAAAWDKVSTSPGHEQIVGSWLLTRALAEEPEEVKFIGLAKEALTRYDEGLLAFDDWIIVKTTDGQRFKTNVGALVHWELTDILPTQVLGKKGVKKYILELCRKYGNDAHKYLTKLQRLWFRTSTKFGLSLAYDDVKKSAKQQALIDEVKALPKDMDFDERIKAWDTNINKAVKDWFESTDRNSSMIAMANSGARVTPVQVRQMIVSKGLLTSMQGGLEEPIPEALSEGLPVLSYIRTCGPARRGLAMNSFMVPASGYLERQLVNLCRDLNITTHDCKAEKGIELESSKAEGKVLAEPVGDLKRGTILYKHMLKDLPKTVVVRSPIMCEHDNGLCAVCCGLNPATQDFYRLGTGIGVMAGTSTGEPMSQAGLRGKHCEFGTSEFTDINGRKIRFKDAFKAVNAGHKIYVHSLNQETNKFEVKLVKKVWQQRWESKMAVVTLDNGEQIKCTLDHPLMRRDGTLADAKDLKPGDSMMPVYLNRNKEGYVEVLNPDGTVSIGYHLSAEHYDSESIVPEDNTDDVHRHHRDFTRNNDYPTNILKCTRGQHYALHGRRLMELYRQNRNPRAKAHNAKLVKIASEHNREEWRRELTSKTISDWIEKNPELHAEYGRMGGIVTRDARIADPDKWKAFDEQGAMTKSQLAIDLAISEGNFNVLWSKGTGTYSVATAMEKYPHLVTTDYPWYSALPEDAFISKAMKAILTVFDTVRNYVEKEGVPFTLYNMVLAENILIKPKGTRPSAFIKEISEHRSIDLELLYSDIPPNWNWTPYQREHFRHFKAILNELSKLGRSLTQENYNTVVDHLHPNKRQDWKLYDLTIQAMADNYQEMLSYSRFRESKYYNHKVVSVEIVEFEQERPFYGLEVEGEWHTYNSHGIVSHNTSGSVTLADLEYTVGNAVADFIKATGAQATSFLDIASSEAKPATSFNDLPYDQSAKAVLMELHRIFDESGIDIYTTLLEVIVRGLSDVSVLSNGQSFLRSKGYNDPNPKFRTVVDSIAQNPSILKRLGFGWARQALENSVKNADGYQHLPVEKLMMGKLIHDCDRKEV